MWRVHVKYCSDFLLEEGARRREREKDRDEQTEKERAKHKLQQQQQKPHREQQQRKSERCVKQDFTGDDGSFMSPKIKW